MGVSQLNGKAGSLDGVRGRRSISLNDESLPLVEFDSHHAQF